MGFGVGRKYASLVSVIHLNGLEHVNITDADVRTGKISIDKNGNKVVGAATQRFLQRSTADATATPIDINQGKTLYVNGSKITGTYVGITPNSSVRGRDITTYTVATGSSITAGAFVKRVGTTNTVTKVTSASDVVLGIAITGGAVGDTITVRVPYNS